MAATLRTLTADPTLLPTRSNKAFIFKGQTTTMTSMKILVDNLHREYFNENGFIEFEELIKPERLDALKKEIATLQPLQSYDLWRQSVSYQKSLKLSQMAMIASELVEQKPIRIGFDWLLPQDFSGKTLNEISSIQGLLCGLLLSLETGSGTFVDPATPFPEQTGPHLLIAFAEDRAVYIFQESDPNTHYLKQFGYSFGDRLKQAHNPIIYQ